MPSAIPAPLIIETLRVLRAEAGFGKRIEYLAETDSTNSIAETLARAGAAEGAVVIAEAQRRGRGRLGRSWISPPNRNLYLSIVLRPPIAAEEAPKLALVAGLATADAVREWCARAQLKWPNDVLIDGRKVAGILAEMGMDGERLGYVIVGIGVNLNIGLDELPAELRDKAGSLFAASGEIVDRVAFTDRLLSCFEQRYEQFVREGFAATRPAWEGLSCLTGKWVRIDEAQRCYEGEVLGLGDDGTLRLREASGREVHVVAGDVSVVNGYA